MPEATTVPLPTRRATRRLGAALASSLRRGDVLVLEGPLGAGKTFLTRAIARALGVPAAVPVTSPTFALVHEIPGAHIRLVHADLYRLASATELIEIGLDEGQEMAITIVEWGARFGSALAADRLEITLARPIDAARHAVLVAHGVRSQALLEATMSALAVPAVP